MIWHCTRMQKCMFRMRTNKLQELNQFLKAMLQASSMLAVMPKAASKSSNGTRGFRGKLYHTTDTGGGIDGGQGSTGPGPWIYMSIYARRTCL